MPTEVAVSNGSTPPESDEPRSAEPQSAEQEATVLSAADDVKER